MVIDGTTLQILNQPRVLAKLGITSSGSVPPTRLISTTAPLAGGGDLSSDRVLSMPAATNAVDGYLTAVAFVAFSAKESPLTFNAPLSRALNAVSLPAATGAVNGYLSAADFTTFAAKVSASRTIATTAPITGGGDLSSDRTFAMAKSTAAVDGYLAAADFTAFNAKVATTRSIATTAPLTGGGDLSADRTHALDFTVSWIWTANGIAATPTDRLVLTNTTAAISGTQQYSPALRFTGQGWGTTAGTSQACDWRTYIRPVQATVPSADIMFDFSVAGGAFANKLTISSGNTTLTTAGAIVTGGLIQLGTNAQLQFLSKGNINAVTDGVWTFRNNASNDFGRLQFGKTDNTRPALAVSGATLKCRLADDSADAAFTALSFQSANPASGTAKPWKFGSVITAASVLDTSRYVELDVNGTLVKLALMT